MSVMKFGGTSIENATAIDAIVNIVQGEINKSSITPVVIVSACAGMTNRLLAVCKDSASGNLRKALLTLEEVKNHHLKIIEDFKLSPEKTTEAEQKVLHTEKNIKKNLKAIYTIGECPASLLDDIVSNGELLSSYLLSLRMNQQGLKAIWMDARKLLITDENFTRAKPMWDISEKNINKEIKPHLQAGTVVISQGFIASTMKGKTTTLGRGGSDYSAAIFGAMLDLSSIQIWTDVDGVLTADPKVVPNARRLKQMTFNEAAELAYFGAKVLHPATIQPAVQKNIPVYVLNSRRPHIEGTLITKEVKSFDGLVKAIASKKHQIIVNIISTKMLGTVGFLYNVAKIFSDNDTPIDMISTSEISISLTIGDKTNLDKIVEKLSEIADVKIKENVAIICVVGDSLPHSCGVVNKIFSSVAENNVSVMMISQGSSETNVGFVVDDVDADTVVRTLHKKFFAIVKEKEIFDIS